MEHLIDRKKVINAFDEAKELVWTDDDEYAVGYNNGLEAGKNIALALLKEQEVRELTIDEWQEWKNNSKRNPICELWEHDTSPMWVLNPDTIHEPALLMGKLKLFTGKPTFEQCKAVKWE